jgi:hypothetical protein
MSESQKRRLFGDSDMLRGESTSRESIGRSLAYDRAKNKFK